MDWDFLARATVFPPDMVIFMRSVSNAEEWAIIRALEQIKDLNDPNLLFSRTQLRVLKGRLLPSLHRICPVSWLVQVILILNVLSAGAGAGRSS